MKIKKTLIITLFLLCILMIGAVSASSDNDTRISNNANDDTVVSSDVSDDTPVSSDVSDDTITTTNDNTGKKKTSTIDTTTKIKKANNNDKPIKDVYNPKSYTELNKTVNNATAEHTIELNSNFIYKKSSDINFTSGINITRTMTINGHGNIIDGDNQAGIFNILFGAHVKIQNLKFINAKTAINVAEGCTLELINCTFNYNSETINNNGTIVITDSEFSKNQGSIYNVGSLKIINSKIYENTAGTGVIYNNGTLTVTESIFNNNTANFGGAIFSDNKLTIDNTQFNNNTAKDSGGAIYLYEESNTIITSSIFNNNTAEDGGAILNFGKLKITDTQFNNNTAKGKYSDGGAIYTDNELTIEDSQFNNNTADNGGAIYNHHIKNENSKLTIKNSTFIKNNATEDGGAIYTWKHIDVKDSKFIKNNDTNENAIYIVNGTQASIHNNYFLDNNITCEDGTKLDLSDNYINIRLKTKFIIETILNTTTDKTINLNITEINKFSGQITIKIGNNEYNVTLTDGSCINNTIQITKPGLYNVTIDFPGTLGFFPEKPDYREAYAVSNNFTIKYPTKFIIQNITNSTIDKPIIINITEVNNFTGTIPIKIGNNEYNITFTNGTYINDTIILTKIGTYNLTINFIGNENYTAANATSNTFLIKYPTKFIIQNMNDTITTKPLFINITEVNNFTGTIPIKIGNNEYNITFTNGTCINDTIIITIAGTYNLTINFIGNENYTAANATSNTFTIRYPTEFTINYISNSTTENPITVTATEKYKFTGVIPIKIGNNEYNIKFTEGIGTTDSILLPHGTYQAVINFIGNDRYTKASATSNIFKIKYPLAVYEDLTIDISNTILTPVLNKVDEVNYVCYIKDDKKKNFLDGTITVTLYDTIFDQLTLKTKYIPMTYTFEFDESERISGFWILNNDKIVLRKTINSPDEKKSLNIISSTSNSKLYNKLFKGEDGGNTILFMIDNTKFSINQIPVTVDKEIKLVNTFENVTKIKLSYSKIGDPKVISFTKSGVKFTHDIVKSTSKTSSKKVKISLKKVKIKKSAKKLVLKATLKKGKKALKNKKVTFKFNGKKYVRKTNKKGVAKLTIKKSVLKKLKVGKKIKYSVTYRGKTKKRTAKVKK